MICIHASLFAFYDLPSNYRKKIFRMTTAELDNKGCKVFGRSTVQYVVLKVCKIYI